jgi:hypothetical protein
VAILNAKVVNDAIKPFQSHGLVGERDIHKKALDLPIPLFNPAEVSHKEIAELGKQARIETLAFVSSTTLPTVLSKRREMVRNAIVGTAAKIDKAVESLLKA